MRKLCWCNLEVGMDLVEGLNRDKILGGHETGSGFAGISRVRVGVDRDVMGREFWLEKTVVVLIAELVKGLVRVFDGKFVDGRIVETGSLDGAV